MIEEQKDENAETLLIDIELKTTLRNGGAIGPFTVTWNCGLRDCLQEYENICRRGSKIITGLEWSHILKN